MYKKLKEEMSKPAMQGVEVEGLEEATKAMHEETFFLFSYMFNITSLENCFPIYYPNSHSEFKLD